VGSQAKRSQKSLDSQGNTGGYEGRGIWEPKTREGGRKLSGERKKKTTPPLRDLADRPCLGEGNPRNAEGEDEGGYRPAIAGGMVSLACCGYLCPRRESEILGGGGEGTSGKSFRPSISIKKRTLGKSATIDFIRKEKLRKKSTLDNETVYSSERASLSGHDRREKGDPTRGEEGKRASITIRGTEAKVLWALLVGAGYRDPREIRRSARGGGKQ